MGYGELKVVVGYPANCTSNFKDGSTLLLALCKRNVIIQPVSRYIIAVVLLLGFIPNWMISCVGGSRLPHLNRPDMLKDCIAKFPFIDMRKV